MTDIGIYSAVGVCVVGHFFAYGSLDCDPQMLNEFHIFSSETGDCLTITVTIAIAHAGAFLGIYIMLGCC